MTMMVAVVVMVMVMVMTQAVVGICHVHCRFWYMVESGMKLGRLAKNEELGSGIWKHSC